VESVRPNKQNTRVQPVLLNSKHYTTGTALHILSIQISPAVPFLAITNIEVLEFALSFQATRLTRFPARPCGVLRGEVMAGDVRFDNDFDKEEVMAFMDKMKARLAAQKQNQ